MEESAGLVHCLVVTVPHQPQSALLVLEASSSTKESVFWNVLEVLSWTPHTVRRVTANARHAQDLQYTVSLVLLLIC